MTEVLEHKKILRNEDGVIRGKYDGYERILDENSVVSMNMWGFGEDFISVIEKRFSDFLENLEQDDEKTAELTIAQAVQQEIEFERFRVLDIPTKGQWYGITYESDVNPTREVILDYISKGIYTSPLEY